MKESTKDIILSAGFDINSDIEVPEAAKFTKDMKEKLLHIENISRAEIKTLVNLFYQMQEYSVRDTDRVGYRNQNTVCCPPRIPDDLPRA